MKRALLLLSIVVAACATSPQQRSQHLVNRAVDAMGGAAALGTVKTLALSGTSRQWEPEQSFAAGGIPRFANESTFAVVADLSARSTRVDWVKKFEYPTPRTFTFSEIVTPEAGYVAGIDSNSRNKQNLESKPPGHSMSGLRLAATLREFRRASPLLLLEMRNNPDRVTASPDVVIGGIAYPAVAYKSGDTTFTVMFDPQTGLPARIRTLDFDGTYGDSTFDLVLGGWQSFGGIKVATAQQYLLNGTLTYDNQLEKVAFNAPVAADRFAIPAGARATASKPATGAVPYQWALRRQIIGIYLDSNNPSFDALASPGLRLVEVAPGVQHVVGGSHNSLIVEMSDHLIVFDAPVSDAQSNGTIKAAKDKYPGKPIRYLVLSHHHMDHSSGFRAYAAEGATIVVGKGNAMHFRKYLGTPFSLDPDVAQRDLSRTSVIEVADKQVFSDGKREVQAILLENPHCAGMLIGYVADARLGYVVDIWSPGVPLPDKINPALLAVVNGVKKAGIAPTRFAGGHGGVADYATLTRLAN